MPDRKITSLIVESDNPGGFQYKIGQDIQGAVVTRIEEHSARGEGDKWYYDIHFDDGTTVRDFQSIAATFAPEEK